MGVGDGWGKINIKDQVGPPEAETATELGNNNIAGSFTGILISMVRISTAGASEILFHLLRVDLFILKVKRVDTTSSF